MIIAVPKYIRACYFPHNVTFANYSYFLWAPTLVYQINYPRAKKIRLRHIYVECVTTLHLTQNSATLVTFILSTGVYEYVIGCSLGLYKPILKAVFVIPSLLFIYITAFFRGWNGWNVFMWFVLFIGHGTLLGLYSRAWQLRELPAEGPLAWWDALYIDRVPLFPSFDRLFG